MNPLNMNIRIKAKKPKVDAATIVRKIDATKRHMDVDARCTANSARNWRKNLKNSLAEYET